MMNVAWKKEEKEELVAGLGPDWVLTPSRPHCNIAWRPKDRAPWFAKVFKWEDGGQLYYGLDTTLLVSGSACRTLTRLVQHILNCKRIETAAKRDIEIMFRRMEYLDSTDASEQGAPGGE